VWVFSLRILNRGLGFIRTIILARLLAPEDFGLLGIAMLAISTLETFSQTGFQAALIQKNEDIESYLDTAWTVSAIRGLMLFLILFFAAPSIAEFFNSPQATLIIRVIAVSTLLSGLRNIGIIFFRKELEFNKQFFYEFSATIVDLGVAVTLAFLLRNVWALVWGGLAANFVRLFMSYIIQPYRPRIGFEKERFLGLFGFGRWVLGSSILIFLITQGDDIFLGKMLGVTALGLYQMAYLISNLPATEITHVISQVTFPAYSKLQDDLPKLRESYLKVLQITIFISAPVTGGIFILAPEFTEIFLGDKWMPMVPAMQLLCMSGLARSFGATTGPLFHSIGQPKILTNLAMLQLLILAVIIYPLTKQWELVGISVAVVIPNVITQLLAAFEVINIVKARCFDFLMFLLLPLTATLGMISSILFFINLSEISLSSFLICIFLGVISYIAIIYILDLFYSSRYKTIFWSLIKSLN